MTQATATFSAANVETYPKSGVLAQVGAWFMTTMDHMAQNNPRMRQVRALQAMTDTQLADRGIARDDIVRHVFQDTFYR